MLSPNSVLVYGPGASVTDSAGNIYTITAASRITISGEIDPPSLGVVALAFYQGAVYQKNDLNLWYSQSTPDYAVNGWTSYGPGVHPVPFTVSVNDTFVAAGSGGSIIDANGDEWTITAGGQVGFDGVADTLTANVIAMAYVDGVVWQENASGRWWAKTGGTGSYDGWSSGPGTENSNGTLISPLPAGPLTWIGGGDNSATNPLDWSPAMLPKAGDTLTMTAGTINIANSTLAGDVLNVADYDPGEGSVTINLNGGAHISVADTSQAGDFVTVNATGNNSINLTNSDALAAGFNLAANASLVITGSMTFVLSGDFVADTGARIVNDGTLFLSEASITGTLAGNGSLVLGGSRLGAGQTTIDGSVAKSQTVNIDTGNLGAELTLVEPKAFKGDVVISDEAGTPPDSAEIDLEGLTATSYEFKNGLLTLFSGNTVVDRLRLDNQTSNGITVQSPQSVQPDSVLISFYHEVPAPGTQSTLPLHT